MVQGGGVDVVGNGLLIAAIAFPVKQGFVGTPVAGSIRIALLQLLNEAIGSGSADNFDQFTFALSSTFETGSTTAGAALEPVPKEERYNNEEEYGETRHVRAVL